eukprot:6406109-Pyramimonas_sp.AAC.1
MRERGIEDILGESAGGGPKREKARESQRRREMELDNCDRTPMSDLAHVHFANMLRAVRALEKIRGRRGDG